MRNFSIKAIICLMLSQCCHPSQSSFFMTEKESAKVLNFINSKNTEKPQKVVLPKRDLKISGIFYVDNNTWTVWINDIAYSTIGQQVDFSIDEVSENSVSLTLQDGATLCLSVSPDTPIATETIASDDQDE